MPDVYIITGSNGAGKSSIGPTYLPQQIIDTCTVFDGDKLFMQKQRDLWQSGIRANKEARKLAATFVQDTFDALVVDALTHFRDFVYEGHFTNDATWDIPKQFKAHGFGVHLLFFGLADPNQSEFRVIERSNIGGHYVPRSDIDGNFFGNLEKLNIHFDFLDSLKIFDTSSTQHILLLDLLYGQVKYVIDAEELPEWFVTQLPRLSELVNKANRNS